MMNYKTILPLMLFLFLISCNNWGNKIEVEGGEVYYKDPVTENEAKALADYLKDIGYFKDEVVTVQLLKENDKYTVNFVIQEDKINDSTIVAAFKTMSPILSYGVFDGAIVNIGLNNTNMETEKFIPGYNYGTLIPFGKDKLYYTKEIDRATAEKFGNYLKESQFFSDRGLDAQLTKKGNTYQFRYVIQEGYENDESYKATAREYAKLISKQVFDSAPVEIHMCDDSFNTLIVISSP